MTTTICSTCPYCGVGCGVVASQLPAASAGQPVPAALQQAEQGPLAHNSADSAATGPWQVLGDKTHPANFGRLCVKGSALDQTLSSPRRLTQPVVDGVVSSWPQAISAVSGRLQAVIDQHGPGAVAMYLSGQLLTEDYYVANKLLKGFIGSPHVDTNSRLCMASTVAGHKRAFGADVVPGCYQDLEQAKLLVLVGANMAWNHPVLFQRIQARRQQDPSIRLVVIDPRRTASCEVADLHLPLLPGTDVLLFQGLLCWLAQHACLNQQFIDEHCDGFADTLAAASAQAADLAQLAAHCQLPLSVIQQFYQWFAKEPLSVTLYSQGVNQASDGTDKVNAILNCHLATGRIGLPGCGPFSLTGQPNAMGGREVGGLANQLAAGIDYSDPQQIDVVQQFWQAPALVRQPGFKAVELFQAIARGDIKAVWIIATNPVVSMPEADRVKAALALCPLVIVSDIYADTDTLALAHIQLPASGWSEKDGTVTNSERRISRQRAFCPPPGAAKADWQIICEVARAMGFGQAFAFENPAQIFAEHAALSAYQNQGQRAFDLSGLVGLTEAEYQQLAPLQWPVTADYPEGRSRLFQDGQFFTPNQRARLVPLRWQAPLTPAPGQFILNSGRIRDQWHTMTRTGQLGQLMQHKAEPFVQIHPDDAAQYALQADQLVRLSNDLGHMLAKVELSAGQRRGELFVPMHWTEQYSSAGRCDVLFAANTDAISGQPALKHGLVQLQALPLALSVLLLSREALPLSALQALKPTYYSKVPQQQGVLYRLGFAADWQSSAEWAAAGACNSADPAVTAQVPLRPGANSAAELALLLRQWAQQYLPGQLQIQSSSSTGQPFAAIAFVDQQLSWLLSGAAQWPTLDVTWLDSLLAGPVSSTARRQLLSGPAGDSDQSPLICSCFQVRSNAIKHAISAGAHCSASLGQRLRCGTNCGSCLPEINSLLKAHPALSVLPLNGLQSQDAAAGAVLMQSARNQEIEDATR